MANPERGEMTLAVGGEVYTLRLTTNASCILEDRTGGIPFGDLLEEWLARRRFTALRWCVWTCLQDQHGKQFPDPASVGPLLDACPQPELEKLLKAFIKLNTEAFLEGLARHGSPARGGAPAVNPFAGGIRRVGGAS